MKIEKYYDNKIDSYNKYKVNEHGNPIIFNLINYQSKVFDIGCNTGNLAKGLKKIKKCKVYGIDISSKAIDIAKDYLEDYKVIDLEQIDKMPFKDIEFDYVVLADVLEHIRNPKELIEVIKKDIYFDKMLISLPNIAFILIRIKLLLGKFNYEKQGILDESHLHFYTLDSAIKLVEDTGLIIKNIIPYLSVNKKHKIINRFILYLFPKLLAKQFIFVCITK